MTELNSRSRQLQLCHHKLEQLSADIAGHRQELHVLLGRISLWENNICKPIVSSLNANHSKNRCTSYICRT